jgi:hypothetical protein
LHPLTGVLDDARRDPRTGRIRVATQDQGLIPITRPITIRWEAWALLAAAAVAVAVGTYARGVIGTDWIFTTDNLARSAPLAIPFLIAAGVVVGAGRWPAAGRWLLTGAALIALSGALSAAADVAIALWAAEGGLIDLTGWFSAIGILNGAVSPIGYSALAIGLWRSASGARGTARTVGAVAAVIVTLLAAAGPIVTTALSLTSFGSEVYLQSLLAAVLASATAAAIGALAIAALRAAPRGTPLPELLIAAGAIVHAAVLGAMYWVLWAWFNDSSIAFAVLGVTGPLGNAAALVLAAGFASGALFWPAED